MKNYFSTSINDEDFEAFSKKIDEAKEKYSVDTAEELKDKLPAQRSESYGTLTIVDISGIGMTETGELTRTGFFENLIADKDKYSDMRFTPEEAKTLQLSYQKMSTGVNSVVPLLCVGEEKCPFAFNCPYAEIGKTPIGNKCLVERDLLTYHTKKFMQELDVKMEDHTEVQLIQELAESIILEMRASLTLSKPENAELFGVRKKYSPDGDEIEEHVIHWAYELKEKIKNRRHKILEMLNSTRKAKGAPKQEGSGVNTNGLNSLIDKLNKYASAQEVPYKVEEQREEE